MPSIGVDKKALLEELKQSKSHDVDWRHGRGWSLVYYAGDEHTDFIKQVYNLFFSENGAGPALFPSLKKLEAEVVAMVLDLLGGHDGEVGAMTSGGTESILLSMKAYRDYAREQKPEIKTPEIIIPESVHPAFLKAAAYFDINTVYVPLDKNFKADVDKVKSAITDQTICIVASAPSFSHGTTDPIAELGQLALDHDIGLHVDACLGSFLLPFIKKLGHHITDFDFSVPGVTSISADLHKHGYTAKGTSVVLYKTVELRRYQYYVDVNWPGGLYASPTMQGTRPGGAIASAWAAMMVLGEAGYLDLAKRTMNVTQALMKGIESEPELYILGAPEMNVFSFSSDVIDINSLGQRLESVGWVLNRQNNPKALHMIATPNHEQSVEPFLADLKTAVKEEKIEPFESGENVSAVLYGGAMKSNISDDPREIAMSRLDDVYSI